MSCLFRIASRCATLFSLLRSLVNGECTVNRALITRISGQDGSYLAELLLEKGYGVRGRIRRSSSPSPERNAHLLDRLQIVQDDLGDLTSLLPIHDEIKPPQVYTSRRSPSFPRRGRSRFSLDRRLSGARTCSRRFAPWTARAAFTRHRQGCPFHVGSTESVHCFTKKGKVSNELRMSQ